MVPLTQTAMNVSVCILFFSFLFFNREEIGRKFFPLHHCECFHGLRFTKSTSMTHGITMGNMSLNTNLDDVGIYNVQERLHLFKDPNDT